MALVYYLVEKGHTLDYIFGLTDEERYLLLGCLSARNEIEKQNMMGA